MSAGRKPRGGVSFTVVEGGRGLHRQPLVLREQPRRGGLGCLAVALVLTWAACILAAIYITGRFLP